MGDSKRSRRRGRSGIKHLFAQMFLRSSCTTTAIAAADLIQLSQGHHCQCCPNGDRGRTHLAAPVVQVTVHCGARHSFRATEPLPPPERKNTTTKTKKEKLRKRERRVTENGDLYVTGEREGRKCPPASPSSPARGGPRFIGSYTSSDHDVELDLFSSGEEEEEEEEEQDRWGTPLFSSSELDFRRKTKKKVASRSTGLRPPEARAAAGEKKKNKKKSTAGPETESAGGVAIVKNSSDPYTDFRSSMAEMVAERRMSSAREMESLLNWYLSLNSPLHHAVILEAFMDLWEAILGQID